jgi:translation initiation factor IF-2
MAGKVIRLSKLAKQLNVGISTIVDYLSSEGISIDPNPNTKLEPEHVDKLNEQFADDKSLKEEAEKTTISREKRETISLRNKDSESKKENRDTDDEDELELPAPLAPESIKVESPIEEKAAPAEEEKETPPVDEKKTIGEGDMKVSVVGRIDLSSINSKTRPDKKKREERKPDPKPEPKKPTPAEKKKEEPKKEDPKKETPRAPEIETIKVERQKLSGPTVIGKIELPADRKPSDRDEPKRKRKRIKKVEVNQQANKPGGANQGAAGARKGKKFEPKPEISEKDIEKEIKETLARLSSGGGKSKGSKNRKMKRETMAQRREQEMMDAEKEKSVLKLTEFVTVAELASMMNVQPTQVIAACMSLGIFASINQRIDAETISIVADEFGFEVEFVAADVQDAIPVVEDKAEDLVDRPPIITVMGHVDHGKTSLLDYVRNANIAEGEAGGITQHVGAYSVKRPDGKKLTFLDTPGHEAFTAMRARGAKVTDVAIIIVAADDDVMPQTKEAIAHAQAADVPMVFAINKIDKPGANPDRIREQLSAMNILVEDWGGKYQCQEISAKKGLHIDELLEKVILEADLLELKANPKKNAIGSVIESSLDKGKGYVTNILVQEGTLRVGDIVLVGRYSGRVRAMHNEHGVALNEAGPSVPLSILGINGAPSAGDTFHVMDDEREARAIATKREQLYREQGLRTQKHITLDEIGRRLAIGDFKELNLIIKGDVDGSIEALSDALLKLSTEEIQVNIVHKGVGAITEADVNLASASDAVIIGFQVRPTAPARKLAESEQIDIRLYSIIYKAIEELKDAMEGMLSPDIVEQIIGTAEVRETFAITKVGTIAGCYVQSGLIKRSSKVRVIRDGIVIFDGVLGSLKRFKDDVKEVKNNYECGLNVDKFNDIKEGDIIEAYEEVEVARKL